MWVKVGEARKSGYEYLKKGIITIFENKTRLIRQLNEKITRGGCYPPPGDF